MVNGGLSRIFFTGGRAAVTAYFQTTRQKLPA